MDFQKTNHLFPMPEADTFYYRGNGNVSVHSGIAVQAAMVAKVAKMRELEDLVDGFDWHPYGVPQFLASTSYLRGLSVHAHLGRIGHPWEPSPGNFGRKLKLIEASRPGDFYLGPDLVWLHDIGTDVAWLRAVMLAALEPYTNWTELEVKPNIMCFEHAGSGSFYTAHIDLAMALTGYVNAVFDEAAQIPRMQVPFGAAKSYP